MAITIDGNGNITGLVAGGLPDLSITNADLATDAVSTSKVLNGAITTAKLGSSEQSGLAKAWVQFNGSVLGTFAGGASTVTRTAGSTTATVTTTNAHGLSTGNSVYALSGVAAGAYSVTVLTATTFTITTVATTALNAVAITFRVCTIRASYNVNSVVKNITGDYTINFTTAAADANYAAIINGGVSSANTSITLNGVDAIRTAASYEFYLYESGNTGANADSTNISVTIFR
jgi:hypothetical protein